MPISEASSATVIELLHTQQPLRLEHEIAIRRERIDRELSEIEDRRCAITRAMSTLRTQQQMLDTALEAQHDTRYAELLLDEWEKLRSHPRLADAEVRSSTVDPDQEALLPTCQLEALRRKIDAHDSLRALQLTASHRSKANHAGPEDNTARAWLYGSGVHRRAESGRQPACEQTRSIECRLTAHTSQRDLGKNRILGESRGTHEMTNRLTARERRAVPSGR